MTHCHTHDLTINTSSQCMRRRRLCFVLADLHSLESQGNERCHTHGAKQACQHLVILPHKRASTLQRGIQLAQVAAVLPIIHTVGNLCWKATAVTGAKVIPCA